MTDSPRHSVACVGIVFNDEGKVLVIRRRDTGAWEPPGGVLEPDEGPDQGVVREVLEETGVTVDVERLTGVYKNMAAGVVALAFKCNPMSGSPRAAEESTAMRWLTVEAARQVMLPAHWMRVSDALRQQLETPVRLHDGIRPL